MKPLLRWTCGPCLQQGLDILAESMDRTMAALGEDRFDWMICYNGLNSDQLAFLKDAAADRPIVFESQSWTDCAIPDQYGTPVRSDGSFEWNGNVCGGTLWKVAPARKRIETHEIVMDNDIIMLRELPMIEEFLSSNKVMILEEPIRFYGHYDKFHSPDAPFLNSGFMGFPPGYDYGAALRAMWESTAEFNPEQDKKVPLFNISQADEQGLLMLTLNAHPEQLRVGTEYVHEVLGKDYVKKITGSEYAIHFTQANRLPGHHTWLKYKEIVNNAVF
jgi:hypothetical protein